MPHDFEDTQPLRSTFSLHLPAGLEAPRLPDLYDKAALLLPSATARRSLRLAAQMTVAVFAACLLATDPAASRALAGKGGWAVVTAIVCLEPNLGATARKAALRIGGTLAGGGVACLLLALTDGANGDSWQFSRLKSSLMSALLALSCGAGQLCRQRDTARDYAYVVAMARAPHCVGFGLRVVVVVAPDP